MSIFTPTIYNEPSFSGLFRLLDDFDNYRSASSPNPSTSSGNNVNNQHQRQLAGPRHHSHLTTVNPKFDLQETTTAYELHGELPGIAKDQIHIEFTDRNTLTIRGKFDKSYTKTSSDTPASSSDETTSSSLAAPATSSAPTTDNNNDNEKQTSTTSTEVVSHPTATGTITNEQDKTEVSADHQEAFKPRYWLSERSVGEFSRSFHLDGGAGSKNEEIDHEGVKASLTDGVLHVIVPKVKREDKVARRRVVIE